MAAALGVGLAPAGLAEGTSAAIAVTDAWARATPQGAQTGAAFVTVTNHGATDDKLIGASTPIATMAQLHRTIDDNGVMKMRPVAVIDLKPGASVTLKPGYMHVMLMGLKHPLAQGASFPLTLTFAKAGKIETTVKIEKLGAMTGTDMGNHGEMNSSGMSNMDMGGMKQK
ncbi:MAG TPA: copper chaperone PCu(A)C [Stellaceae bacterium]|nr:copper chaperone PCu(A)C [Stellaceae bacterium]